MYVHSFFIRNLVPHLALKVSEKCGASSPQNFLWVSCFPIHFIRNICFYVILMRFWYVSICFHMEGCWFWPKICWRHHFSWIFLMFSVSTYENEYFCQNLSKSHFSFIKYEGGANLHHPPPQDGGFGHPPKIVLTLWVSGSAAESSKLPLSGGPSFYDFYYNLVINISWKNYGISMFRWKMMPVLSNPGSDISMSRDVNDIARSEGDISMMSRKLHHDPEWGFLVSM